MAGYELQRAPSGRVWRFAASRSDGTLVTEAEARKFAESVGWELHEVSDDGTDRMLWSPPGDA